MAKKCTKCNCENEDEAKFCAQCGAKLEETFPKELKIFFTLILLAVITVISLNWYDSYSRQQKEEKGWQELIKQKEEDKQALIKMTTTDISKEKIDELSSILKQKRNTFETTEEFEARFNKILETHSVGTAILENYDADTAHITIKLSWNKGIMNLVNEELPTYVDEYIQRELAKKIFSKEKVRFYIVASEIDAKLHIEKIFSYVLSGENVLKMYNLNHVESSVLIDTFQVPNLIYDVAKKWEDAKQYCEELTYMGNTDWRLPTKSELKTLYKNREMLTFYESNYYWSSTTPYPEKSAWLIYFYDGTDAMYQKFNSNYVRCIRTVQ